MPNVSVVVPVYRSEKSVGLVVEELARELPQQAEQWEVILVEDDGGDGSWGVIEQLAVQFSFVRGFQLTRNFGQHNALLCGIRAAQYEVILTMDDDLQHPAQSIGALMQKLDEGYDVVYGAPVNERHSLLRNFASVATKIALQGAMGAHTARRVSAFRVFLSLIHI